MTQGFKAIMWTPERWHNKWHDRHGFEGCWKCARDKARCLRKIKFATREEVDEWVQEFNESHQYTEALIRYPCRWCDGYHMAKPLHPHELRRVERQRRKWLVKKAT